MFCLVRHRGKGEKHLRKCNELEKKEKERENERQWREEWGYIC